MFKTIAAAAAAAAILVSAAAVPTQAAAPTATKYRSCKALNAVYPGGVAKTSSAKNTHVVKGKRVRQDSQYKPKVSSSLYAANKGLDRDKDNIACER